MKKGALLLSSIVLLLALPLMAWAARLPAKVYENGSDDNPIPVAGVKVEVFGGYGFKALFSSAATDSDGGCILRNVPLEKEVLVRLTKAGYVTQYDIRSYTETGQDVILWIGSDDRINGMYSSLGEAFNAKKGNIYLDISDELSGDGIDGVQFMVSSGKVFDLGGGEYLIANAEGSSLKIDIQKPGYAFDIESATIPLFAGAITQYYIAVQSDGGVSGSVQSAPVTSAFISGKFIRLSDAAPISGVSVAFTNSKKQTLGRAVFSKPDGTYTSLDKFPVSKNVIVTGSSISGKTSPFVKSFKPAKKTVTVKKTGATTADFKGVP